MVICHPEGGANNSTTISGLWVHNKMHPLAYYFPKAQSQTRKAKDRAEKLSAERADIFGDAVRDGAKPTGDGGVGIRAWEACAGIGLGTGIVSATAASGTGPGAGLAFIGGTAGGCMVGWATVMFG